MLVSLDTCSSHLRSMCLSDGVSVRFIFKQPLAVSTKTGVIRTAVLRPAVVSETYLCRSRANFSDSPKLREAVGGGHRSAFLALPLAAHSQRGLCLISYYRSQSILNAKA